MTGARGASLRGASLRGASLRGASLRISVSGGQGERGNRSDPDAPCDQAKNGGEPFELPRHGGRAADARQEPVDRLP